MANRAKAKGTAFETLVCNYLNEQLGLTDADGKFHDFLSPLNVKRQAQVGAKDVGDAWAPPFCLEMKDTAQHDIPGYIRQANTEAANAGLPYGVAIVKKRRANVADSYVCMDLATFARVLSHIRKAPQ
ncbi:hypothetical protein [Streptomyces malaysiensis]